MRRVNLGVQYYVIGFIILGALLLQPAVYADIDVQVQLNNVGFVSFDHFKAELYLNNHDAVVPDAMIFGILEILGEYFYWPNFTSEVNFQTMDIEEGEFYLTLLEFDFPDIEATMPFGPMLFWGAWYVDLDHYAYDVEEFWLDGPHKWTPTGTPTETPVVTPTSTATPDARVAGELYSEDNIVGKMRFVPRTGPDGFTQGSQEEEPCRHPYAEEQFTHILTRNIAVMETEVTRGMWVALKVSQPTLPDDPSWPEHSPSSAHPVQFVSWDHSILYANLLSLANGFTPCYYKDEEFTVPVDETNYTTVSCYCNLDSSGYRLPLEGEWEYFCRAGTKGAFSCNEPEYSTDNCIESCVPGTHPTLEQYCVYCANEQGTSAIPGTKLANPWNLKDVHGNVWEWCWDYYAQEYPSGTVTDYTGSPDLGNRVVRGGGWLYPARDCRSAWRYPQSHYYQSPILGFRLVRTIH